MTKQLSRRFWVETALAVASVALFAVTLLWHDWIEIVFRLDPDQGSGALEWLIVVAALVAALAFSVLARAEWRKAYATVDAR